MCGLFAFTGTHPDPTVLTDAATAAAARGPHGHGWATHPDPIIHRAPGPLDPTHLADLDAPRIIGHARLATRGDYRNTAGIQPCTADGHLITHNGTIRNWETLDPHAPSDSAALATTYAARRKTGDGPATALRAALEHADTPAWALLVLDATGALLAWRRGLPLWRLDHPTGVYYASRRFHPDAAELATDALTVDTP
jgi:asparagine synthetase B (glutamine-hydrolysing)